MSLAPGVRLGPYEILSPLGSGGMGDVYRARDTRLDRTVAIKVLAVQLASDPVFRKRFEREARALSKLDHPHICALYDVGEVPNPESHTPSLEPIHFLVMQYLEGETLADRLQNGALPLDQSLRCAIEMADALDKAHRAGIHHRDLKPANIMLTKGGAKLLDFGLAKSGDPIVAGARLSALPTTPPALTAQGTILGTFQYMAPEQLEGKEADARTDIFAFGAVIYEMLTGKKAFEGKSYASLIGAILKDTPPLVSTIQPLTPLLLDHIVRRCLAKDPDERWQSAADLMRDLKLIADGVAGVALTTGALPRVARRERIAWISALALVTLIAAVAIVWDRRPAPSAPSASEIRLEITTPPTTDPASLAVSPDGQKIVFAATSEGRPGLWLRSLDSVSARPLAGTEGGFFPFWSPDSQSVGFFADGKLKRIDIDGGLVRALANASNPFGGAWNRDGTILFAPNATGPIFRTSATSGEPTALTRIEAQQSGHSFPQFLPDDRHFLYSVDSPETGGVYIGQLGGSETRRVLDAPSAVYASSGHLLFVRQGTLFAQTFDPVRLALTGNPFPVAEQVAVSATVVASAALSASAAGPIAYRAGLVAGSQRQFVWIDRSGKEMGKVGDPDDASLGFPAISPDRGRVALMRGVGNLDIWLLDLGRGVLSRFTFDAATEGAPIWSPDGSRIVFNSNRKGVFDIYQKPATGPGTEELLLATPQNKAPADWSPDGRFLLYRSPDPKMGFDLWALPLDGDRKPFTVVQTNFEESYGQFSPDGKWVAYQSNESGRFEIYVQPFPGPGSKAQISTTGGAQMRWRRDGKEVFYIALDGRLMAVPIRLASDGQAVEVGAPVPLFVTRVGGAVQGASNQQYMASPDGQRFLMNTLTEEATAPITVILNWKPKG